MKKVITLIEIVFCLHVNAQTNVYHPFPNSNAVWRVNSEGYNGVGLECAFYQYTMEGDTTIGTYTYKKIYQSGFFNCGGICGGTPPGLVISYPAYCSSYTSNYKGGLWQDSINKKVYFLNAGAPPSYTPTIIYDFSKLVGDSINSGGWVKIDSIDSVLVGTNYHKRFNVHGSSGGMFTPPYTAIVEGVGATSGLLEPLAVFEYSSILTCFNHFADNYPNSDTACPLITNTLGIKQITINKNVVTVYPNPNNGSFIVEPNDATKQIVMVYDVTGKLVLSQTISSKATIDAGGLSEGVYNISIGSSEGVINKRLVIVK